MTAACLWLCLRLRLRGWGQVGIGVGDEDSLAEVAGVGGAKGCGLRTGSVVCAGDVEAGDAAVEPKTGNVGHVGGGDCGVEVEQDAEMAAAGFSEEVIEVVEGAEVWGDLLRVGGVGLERCEEDGVGAERMNVIEPLCNAVETASAGGVEVGGVHLVDDGSLPPEIGCHAGTHPAGSREGLGTSEGNGRGQNAGEAEREESEGRSMEVDHALVIEML